MHHGRLVEAEKSSEKRWKMNERMRMELFGALWLLLIWRMLHKFTRKTMQNAVLNYSLSLCFFNEVLEQGKK